MHIPAQAEQACKRQVKGAAIQCCYLTAKPEMPFSAIQIGEGFCSVNFGGQDIIIKGCQMQTNRPAKLALLWPVIGDVRAFQNKAILKIIDFCSQMRALLFVYSGGPIGYGIEQITAISIQTHNTQKMMIYGVGARRRKRGNRAIRNRGASVIIGGNFWYLLIRAHSYLACK